MHDPITERRFPIEDVRPTLDGGAYPAKAVVGEHVPISAIVYREGHDLLAARVRWRRAGGDWAVAPMALDVNDRWEGEIATEEMGPHEVQVEAWTDRFATWRHDVELKAAADVDDSLATEIEEGALLIERNVLEWRLDPASKARIPQATDHDVVVILVCSEGYSSSLAAASLQDLGLRNATDLIGGFQAWRDAGLPVTDAG